MIIIKNKAKICEIYVPKNKTSDINYYTMKFIGQFDNNTYKINVVDLNNYSDYFYFKIDFSNFTDQEYKYHILDKQNDTIATGLIRIGDVELKSTVEIETYTEKYDVKYYED